MRDLHRSDDRGREFDVVVWGATGFTGRLVAEYLASHYAGSDLRWAIAGRSREKLAAVGDALTELAPGARPVPMVIADSHDESSLRAMAARTAVVSSTVGPFALYGGALVAACVAERTDYSDLAGEALWIRAMVDAHHQAASSNNTRIVHCCGFDSIPSDLGCSLVQEHMHSALGVRCDEVRLYVRRLKGGFSGGTIASMENLFEQLRQDKSARRVVANPYGINPEGERQGPDRPDQQGLAWDGDAKVWTGPFIMAAINTRVVRRSQALLGFPSGRDFRYSEVMSFPSGARGLLAAGSSVAFLGAFGLGMAVTPVRSLLKRFVLAAPGSGPSREGMAQGLFDIELVGRGGATKARVRVKGAGDPGYSETAKMIGESALCLAVDGDLGGSLLKGGVLTPASAMGPRLVERLRAAGIRFDVS